MKSDTFLEVKEKANVRNKKYCRNTCIKLGQNFGCNQSFPDLFEFLSTVYHAAHPSTAFRLSNLFFFCGRLTLYCPQKCLFPSFWTNVSVQQCDMWHVPISMTEMYAVAGYCGSSQLPVVLWEGKPILLLSRNKHLLVTDLIRWSLPTVATAIFLQIKVLSARHYPVAQLLSILNHIVITESYCLFPGFSRDKKINISKLVFQRIIII